MMRMSEFADLLHYAARGWVRDQAGSMGAALAFYTLFPMAPLLLLVISVVALIVDVETARQLVFGQLRELLGDAGAEAVLAVLRAADKPREGFIDATLGLALLVVGATSVLVELQRDLDRIWGRQPPAGPAWRAMVVPPPLGIRPGARDWIPFAGLAGGRVHARVR